MNKLNTNFLTGNNSQVNKKKTVSFTSGPTTATTRLGLKISGNIPSGTSKHNHSTLSSVLREGQNEQDTHNAKTLWKVFQENT